MNNKKRKIREIRCFLTGSLCLAASKFAPGLIIPGFLALKRFHQPFLAFKYHSVYPIRWNKHLVVEPDSLEKHIEYLLQKNYQIVTVSEFYEARKKKKRGKFICLTFDDGYQDFYSIVAPIFEKYSVRCTVFVTKERIRKSRIKRSKPVLDWLSEGELRDLSNRGFDIQSHGKTHKSRVLKYKKEYGFQEWYIREICNLEPWQTVPIKTHKLAVRVEDLERPINESDQAFYERALKDLKETKEYIESITGKKCLHHCWARNKYSSLSIKAAKDAGFLSTTEYCSLNTVKNYDKIDRIHVGSYNSKDIDLLSFRLKVLVSSGNYWLLPFLMLLDKTLALSLKKGY